MEMKFFCKRRALVLVFCAIATLCLYLNVHTKVSKKMMPYFKSLRKNKLEKPFQINEESKTKKERKTFLILIWKYGPFLENRHIKRYSKFRYSPWENCSVTSCSLSYDSGSLDKADAVVFLMHRIRSHKELPKRRNYSQRWIFLTDESPIHTFLYGAQNFSNYNGLFNWSMSYRSNSDIPVPYGRTISTEPMEMSENTLRKIKKKRKLVAVMGSNCGHMNGRWNYVKELKKSLGDKLDVYGHCMRGNATACPGHFHKDCPFLSDYKFYLAFENCNCREYLTEKVFWNGYEKFAVPVIMGPPIEDCQQLLPPSSFLHVDDFKDPKNLAEYMSELHKSDEDYFEFHRWRTNYRVLNEHGYFGSKSWHYCRICEALHRENLEHKVYDDLPSFWSVSDCDLKFWKL